MQFMRTIESLIPSDSRFETVMKWKTLLEIALVFIPFIYFLFNAHTFMPLLFNSFNLINMSTLIFVILITQTQFIEYSSEPDQNAFTYDIHATILSLAIVSTILINKTFFNQ